MITPDTPPSPKPKAFLTGMKPGRSFDEFVEALTNKLDEHGFFERSQRTTMERNFRMKAQSKHVRTFNERQVVAAGGRVIGQRVGIEALGQIHHGRAVLLQTRSPFIGPGWAWSSSNCCK